MMSYNRITLAAMLRTDKGAKTSGARRVRRLLQSPKQTMIAV